MKRLLLILLAFLALSFTDRAVHAPLASDYRVLSLLQNDKTFLLDYYRKTTEQLQKSTEGLTAAQLQYKPTAEEWSISQCLEHIIVTEKALLGMAKEMMAKPANPERKEEVKVTDQQVIEGITDRSHKAEAPAELIGEGKYTDPAEAFEDFKAQRKETLAFIDSVSIDDMRNHINDSPFGPSDGYHFMLFIAGHAARHTLQIEEVKTKEGFPSHSDR